jgi:replicative DNA helicase
LETNDLKSQLLAERAARVEDSFKLCKFGLSFVDDAIGAIRPSDLIVVAARTGAGKTQLTSLIAQSNAQIGKRVSIIALEAEQYELLRRIKYQVLAGIFYERRNEFPYELNLNFTDWLLAKYGSELDKLESEANEKTRILLGNISIFTPTMVEITKKDFSILYDHFKENSDLILLDHLHYFIADQKESEYDHLRKIMWHTRDLINRHRVPIVAMSHLRKESFSDKALVPPLNMLHGSSEISKQANAVISLGRGYGVPSINNPKTTVQLPAGSTFVRVLKTRTGHGGCESVIALMNFNLKKQSYEASYIPYDCDANGDKLSIMTKEQFKPWMKNARIANI